MKQSASYIPVAKRGTTARENVVWGWIWELASIATALGSLAAVVSILVTVQDQPLADWTFFISLNATIALLITASKAAAMFTLGSCFSQAKWLHFKASPKKVEDFDLFQEASRGPIGALGLLLTSWVWTRPLLVVGSVATVFALAVDTFGQLLVNIDSTKDIEVRDGRTSFGYTHIYDSGAQSQWPRGGIHSGLQPNASTVDTTLQGAIYKALYNVEAQPVFNCTSRCHWRESYVSLGFATNCTDVTVETHETIQQDDTLEPETWFNMTTPGRISLRAGYLAGHWLTLAQVAAVDLLNKYSSVVPDQSFPISSDFARIAVLTGSIDQGWNSSFVQDIYPANWKVFECTVSIAAYEYSDMWANGNQFTGNISAIELTNGRLNYDWFIFNETTDLPKLAVQGIDLAGLNEFFTSSRFSGSIYSGDMRPDQSTGMGDVLRKADVPELFGKMADSMTEQLRSGYNRTAEGFAVESVVFVQVRWQWLSLPVFVAAAAACQLAYTMASCESEQSLLWKSSEVAVLFYELSRGKQPNDVARTDLRSKAQLKALARKTWITVES